MTSPCAWQPQHLENCLIQMGNVHAYNEVPFDATPILEQMPFSIEAFFTISNDASARATHERFLEEYKITDDDVPLLAYNLGARSSPFRTVR
jgi:hypothetical protein